jgi:hypothetical protein
MHPDDYHLIEKHKALLPTFEQEKDAESKIDVRKSGEEKGDVFRILYVVT